jgi:hypothetical protein
MNRKDARVTPLRAPVAQQDAPADVVLSEAGAQIGRLAAIDNGVVTVVTTARPQTIAAKLAVAVSAEQLQQALTTQQPVVIVFENGAIDKPIIVGFVAPAPLSMPANTEAGAPNIIEADVDGRRVKLVGKDEIVLECGQASITLRRNGRVVIRGTHVESYSDGTNRIKGGQVRIN